MARGRKGGGDLRYMLTAHHPSLGSARHHCIQWAGRNAIGDAELTLGKSGPRRSDQKMVKMVNWHVDDKVQLCISCNPQPILPQSRGSVPVPWLVKAMMLHA